MAPLPRSSDLAFSIQTASPTNPTPTPTPTTTLINRQYVPPPNLFPPSETPASEGPIPPTEDPYTEDPPTEDPAAAGPYPGVPGASGYTGTAPGWTYPASTNSPSAKTGHCSGYLHDGVCESHLKDPGVIAGITIGSLVGAVVLLVVAIKLWEIKKKAKKAVPAAAATETVVPTEESAPEHTEA